MSELLIETYNKELQLLTEKQDLPPGCLGVLKGVCADYKDPTRNGRFYSEKLWRKVFDDDRIKEGLATKTLFGELDHPADRLESLAKEAAVVMTKYEFDEGKKQVLGEFYILDTPNGRILKSLADFGSKMGVSSRGRGEISEKDNTVAEDSYIFGGFDVVTLPAIPSARPEYKLTNESLEVKNFSSSIMEEIETANLEELGKIENIVKIIELPEETMLSLNESIGLRKESFHKSGSNAIVTDNKLQEDLEEAYKTIERLEQELKVKETLPEPKQPEPVVEQVVTEEETSLEEESVDEDWTDDTISHEDLYLEVANLKDQLEGYQQYQIDLETLKSAILERERSQELLQRENQSLIEQLSELSTLKTEYEGTTSGLKEKFHRLEVEYENLKEDHKGLRVIVGESKKLKEEVENLKSINEKLTTDKATMSEKIESLTQASEELLEMNGSLREMAEQFSTSYIEVRANQTGLNEQLLKEGLSECFGVDDVEGKVSKLYKEKSRTSSLPFASGTLISLKEQNSPERYQNAKKMLNNFKPKNTPKGGNT